MTGIFSSTTTRLDSEETLAGGGTSVVFDGAAAAVVMEVEGAVPLGLMFSLVAGWEAWGAACEGRGAGLG